MYGIIVDIIRIVKSTDGVEIFRIISLISNVIMLILSIICTKHSTAIGVNCFNGKTTNIIVTIILPFWAIIFNTINAKRRIELSPKTCNKCGSVTKAKYPVCMHCKSENDFTYADKNLSEITTIYKKKILPLSISAIAIFIAVVLANPIIIYLGV